jgi:tRNA pseudouridine38-40 synthase
VPVRNLRLTIEFDGAAYAGWQYQPDHPTVQGTLEAAVKRVTDEPVTLYGCGRTDAGVSARNYVANFHTGSGLRNDRLRLALNWHLPKDIHVLTVDDATPGFHARHDAKAKTYVYRIVLGMSPLRRGWAWEFKYPLDVARLRSAAALLTGTRDFRPFCQTQDKDGRCAVLAIEVTESDDEVTVSVRGDRFLYKMVRRIVGALVAYGTGRITKADIRSALAGRKHQPFQTAPAQGLLLDSVEY